MEEDEQHAGLGGGGGWGGFQTLVYDPKLSAGRGVQYSAAAAAGDEDVGPLDDSVPVHYYPEGQETVSASTNRPLDSSNKGFQLLQRMGWGGKGLGRNEHGITEPVNAGVEAGVRLGLGKQAQDDHYTAAENISRRKLEVEIQAEEAPERRERREAQALREQQIKEDVTQIKKTFYCQVCSKQYQTAMELEEHLSSYDHHHKKRLAEARAAELERTRDERARKEQRRQQREQQRLEEQIRRAQAAAGVQPAQRQQQQPPLPPPPVPHEGGAGGGWGWSAPAPPLPPGDGCWSSAAAAAAAAPTQQQQHHRVGGWASSQAAAHQQQAAQAVPPPPPPPPDTDGPPPLPPPPPPAAAAGLGTAAAGVTLSLRAGAPAAAGRGLAMPAGRGLVSAAGRRPGMLTAKRAVGRGLAGRKPVAAGNVFGESSSEDEAS